jgi:hypothetical protein
MKKQSNQYTYRDAIQSARKKADDQKAAIEAEIEKLEAEIAMRKFAIEQIDEVIATMEKQTGGALPEHLQLQRPMRLDAATPVRPPLKGQVAKLDARKRPGRKKAKTKKTA